MASIKFLFAFCIIAIFSMTVNAGFFDSIYPSIKSTFYSLAPTKEGYRFTLEDPNGSKREEVGVVMNPGTKDEQLVVMGSYSAYDAKTDTDSITMYTIDKDGYQPRYMLKSRKLSPKALQSTVS